MTQRPKFQVGQTVTCSTIDEEVRITFVRNPTGYEYLYTTVTFDGTEECFGEGEMSA